MRTCGRTSARASTASSLCSCARSAKTTTCDAREIIGTSSAMGSSSMPSKITTSTCCCSGRIWGTSVGTVKTAGISFHDKGNCAYKDVSGCWSWTANSRARNACGSSAKACVRTRCRREMTCGTRDATWRRSKSRPSIKVCSKTAGSKPPKRESVASIKPKIEAHHARSSSASSWSSAT